MRRLQIEIVELPLARPFVISRGARLAVTVVRVAIEQDGLCGWGECTPTARYQEYPDSVCEQLEAMRSEIEAGIDSQGLRLKMPPGSARNALDCALLRLDAARTGRSLWQVAGCRPPVAGGIVTAETLSLGSVAMMSAAAADAVSRGATLLKIKLDRDLILEKVSAIRACAPQATLIIDANEAWGGVDLHSLFTALQPYNIAMIEQPLPADDDSDLMRCAHPIPVCADESCHHAGEIADLRGRYEMINIKLDKCGGLTEALVMAEEASRQGLRVMVGCMLGSSLAMEAALPVAVAAEIVDLDGPLWLAEDVAPRLEYSAGRVWFASAPSPVLSGENAPQQPMVLSDE
ncbi:N-acetyl-D-Glu racemase DgcA [Biostraticola tofi]|uniref:Dipeptide epimerase n=1 Tax=Biostraticola tofi TaxID=466109 RepID=A0A4R3YPF4_9GAMM|nr:N-acetyl-D-Glu racemase DgcA [Biostraticola tofi]TCV93044.1 L-alanine-DL-glutamate epimerase-like enolase superfamily enzyme [Biostraticola tofi]